MDVVVDIKIDKVKFDLNLSKRESKATSFFVFAVRMADRHSGIGNPGIRCEA